MNETGEWLFDDAPRVIKTSRRERPPRGFVVYNSIVSLSEEGAWLAVVMLDRVHIHTSENESKQSAKGACDIAVTISEQIRNP